MACFLSVPRGGGAAANTRKHLLRSCLSDLDCEILGLKKRKETADPAHPGQNGEGKTDSDQSFDMKTAYIMIGIQGSGKSEFCRRHLADVERVNLDTLKTRNKEKKMIEDCLARGVDFVIDNTNPTKEDRARYIPAAKAKGYWVVGYFMQSRVQDCIARNNLREGKAVVPAKAIAMTSNRLELPCKEEGFDELYFVANDGSKMTVSEWREDDEV